MNTSAPITGRIIRQTGCTADEAAHAALLIRKGFRQVKAFRVVTRLPLGWQVRIALWLIREEPDYDIDTFPCR